MIIYLIIRYDLPAINAIIIASAPNINPFTALAMMIVIIPSINVAVKLI